jgi:hypothetical protein
MHYCNGVCIYHYLSIFVVVIRFEVFARSPRLVARLANRTSRPRRHQDGAASATEALRAVFADNGATAAFVTAARIIFAHSVFVSLLTTRLI